MPWGDCETCKHYETYICEDCEHYRDLDDLYEPISEKERAELEEKERQERITAAITEWVEFELTEEFRIAFEKVLKFTSHNHFRECYMAVWVDAKAKCLAASDTRTIIEVPCSSIPQELAGKMIYKIEDNRLGIANGSYPAYKGHFETFNDYYFIPINEFTFEEIEKKEQDPLEINMQYMLHKNTTLLFNADYINLMRETLTGDIQVAYADNKGPVYFKDNNSRLIIMPIRQG